MKDKACRHRIFVTIKTRRLIPILPCLALASCVAIPANTHLDQKRSLSKYDVTGIDARVELPELKEQADTGFSAADFLTLHSGLVISGEYVDEDFRHRVATSRESQDGFLELGFSVPISEGGAGIGSCAPVTPDGYFLTAAHVLSAGETFAKSRGRSGPDAARGDRDRSRVGSYVLYATSDDRSTFIECEPLRVVHRDTEADFAIVKADLPTPRYLRPRLEPFEKGTVLFSGGWMHEKGGGEFRSFLPATSSGDPHFTKIVTTLPMIKGDSGSPMIDQQGRLCGVLSTLRMGMVLKLKPRSTAVMMDWAEVERLIERDREAVDRGEYKL